MAGHANFGTTTTTPQFSSPPGWSHYSAGQTHGWNSGLVPPGLNNPPDANVSTHQFLEAPASKCSGASSLNTDKTDEALRAVLTQVKKLAARYYEITGKPLGITDFRPSDSCQDVLRQHAAPNVAVGIIPRASHHGAVAAIWDPSGSVDLKLKRLISHVASRSAGCKYCMAHTAERAHKLGVDDQKLAAVWDYQTSPLFRAAERAALDIAVAAGAVPNAVSDEMFTELRKYWSEDQVVEIVGVIALFGFLNRWNDTMATQLENEPLEFGERHLAEHGWDAGKHLREPSFTDQLFDVALSIQAFARTPFALGGLRGVVAASLARARCVLILL